MRTIRNFAVLATLAVVAGACENITNPVEEFGQFGPPWVTFSTMTQTGAHGTLTPAIFSAPTRPEQDVEVDFQFAGTAVFGQDFMITDREGNPLSGITAEGGTRTIAYQPGQADAAAHDTVWVFVPATATVGRVLDIELTGGRAADGRELLVGHPVLTREGRVFQFTVTLAAAEIPTGTYSGTHAGVFGTWATTVTITDSPQTVGGVNYRYVISDYAAELFGAEIPWAFRVFTDGSVEFPGNSHAFNVTSDVAGHYDFETNTLTYDVTLTCCGAVGATWTTTVTLED
jgi:hypothetical protein